MKKTVLSLTLLLIVGVFLCPIFAQTTVTLRMVRNPPWVSVKDYGAKGDGSTDDTAAIQAAIDKAYTAGASVIFPEGTYMVARQASGTYQKYGLLLATSGITLEGVGNAVIKRFDSINASTTAVADSTGYPHIYVGKLDVGTEIASITIRGLIFQGDNAQHNDTAQAIADRRTALFCAGVRDLLVDDCEFHNIDSSAIYCVEPGTYWHNKKCFDVKIINCNFYGTMLDSDGNAKVRGWAYQHTVQFSMGDGLLVEGCHFNNTGLGVSTDGTYVDDDHDEDDTWTKSSNSFGLTTPVTVPRGGEDVRISNNSFQDIWEHAAYCWTRSTTVTGNVAYTGFPSTRLNDFKMRASKSTITGNHIRSGGNAISINTFSREVTVTGNTIEIASDTEIGAIGIDTRDVDAYITARTEWWTDPSPAQRNFNISNNVITFADGLGTSDAFEIDSEPSVTATASLNTVASFNVDLITISNNTVHNCDNFLRLLSGSIGQVVITGNAVQSNPTGDNHGVIWYETENSAAGTENTALDRFIVTGNTFMDFKHYLYRNVAASATGLINPPAITTGNNFINDNVVMTKITGNAADPQTDYKNFGSTYRFYNNYGTRMTSRNVPFFNSFANSSATGNSAKQNDLEFEATATARLRWYLDDSGTFTRIATSTP